MAITKVTSSVLSSGSATDGYVLTADGSGNSAWEAAAGGTTITINNNADNRIITGSNTANTLNGDANFTYDNSTLALSGTSFNKSVAVESATGNKGFLSAWQDTAMFAINRNPASGAMTDVNRASALVRLESYNSDAFIVFQTSTTNNAVPTERMRINSLGYVKYSTVGAYVNASGNYHETIGSEPGGIVYYIYNTNSTGNCLFLNCSNETSSNFFLAGYSDNAGRHNIYIYSNGNVVNRNNSYGALSDQKLKQDIEDANSQWEDVKAIQFRKYRWKQDVASNADAPYELGVIAQELESAGMHGLVEETDDKEFYDEVVLDENGNPVLDENGNNVTQREERLTGESTKSVKYSILTLKALKALQEAMERIETLEAKITTLENA